jgi:hypothetical protein
MLSVFKTSYTNTVKFHNNDVKFATPYDGDDNTSGSKSLSVINKIKKGETVNIYDYDANNEYIGEVFSDNTIFLKFYDGEFILYYEDKDNNILTDSDPIVHLMYDFGTPTGSDSYNEDFTDEVYD